MKGKSKTEAANRYTRICAIFLTNSRKFACFAAKKLFLTVELPHPRADKFLHSLYKGRYAFQIKVKRQVRLSVY